MAQIILTKKFDKWLARLKDQKATAHITARLQRLAEGNAGDWKRVGEGIFEMRIDQGQGYRMYYTYKESIIIVMLCGGDKNSQERDIKLAKKIAKGLRSGK